MKGFAMDMPYRDMGDGLAIRERSYAELRSMLGWSDPELDATLGQDWREGGASEFVLTCVLQQPKRPENFLRHQHPDQMVRIQRLLLSLRLAAAGDVGIGRVFYARPAAFPLGPGGLVATGSPGFSESPAEYWLATNVASIAVDVYRRLTKFELTDASKLPRIPIALSRFSGAFQRGWSGHPDCLVDDIVALESLVGGGSELSYSLAQRVAAILGADDAERLSLFRSVLSFYDTRSRLVHGAPLRASHQQDLNRESELRDVVRRLLRAMLWLTESAAFYPSKRFLEKRLDEVLLVLDEQRKLQRDAQIDLRSGSSRPAGEVRLRVDV
jgi:hypothetical protein